MYFIWGPWEPDPERRAGVPKVLDPAADVATLRAAVARADVRRAGVRMGQLGPSAPQRDRPVPAAALSWPCVA